MSQDRFTTGLSPVLPDHLVGELEDLRRDMEEAFSRVAAELDSGGVIIRSAITTGEGTAILYAYNVPEKSLTNLNVTVSGKGEGEHGRYHRLITIIRETGNAAQLGPTLVPYPDIESGFVMDAYLEVTGSVVLLVIRGVPAKTIFWSCRIEVTGAVED